MLAVVYLILSFTYFLFIRLMYILFKQLPFQKKLGIKNVIICKTLKPHGKQLKDDTFLGFDDTQLLKIRNFFVKIMCTFKFNASNTLQK